MSARRFAAAASIALAAGLHAPADARVIHSESSLYQNILVTENGSVRCMQFTVRKDQHNQSCRDAKAPKRFVFTYTRMMLAALLLDPEPQRILVVGLGGGTLPTALAELYPRAHIDVVELDPAVLRVARAYFDFKTSANVEVFVQDARVWTKRALARADPPRFDLVMLDAFNGDYIPEHLMTREYLQETKALVADGGVVAANTFSTSKLYDSESVTYADVFGTFLNLKPPDSANRVIVAVRSDLPDKETLARNARKLERALAPYGVPIDAYPNLMTATPDWDTGARVLTDQYSPANLLQGRP